MTVPSRPVPVARLSLLAALVLPLAACSAEIASTEHPEQSSEPLCSDPGVAGATLTLPANNNSAWFGQSSPSTGYGNTACSAWVVDIEGVQTSPGVIPVIPEGIYLGSLPTTAGACTQAGLTTTVYGIRAGNVSVTPIGPGPVTVHGQWTGSYCWFPDATVSLSASDQQTYTGLRVSSSAWTVGECFYFQGRESCRAFQQPVWSGVYDPRIPG